MRAWHHASLALERHFEPNSENHRGVYDRRFPTIMFTARSISALLAFTAFVYSLSFSTLYTTTDSLAGPYGSTVRARAALAKKLSIQLDGTFVNASDGTQVVFQRAVGVPMGTILFFHGCSHSATDFFPAGPKCSKCIGLPEELHLIRLSLGNNFSVIAVSSTDRTHKCWRTNASSPSGNDYDRVATALKVATEHGVYNARHPLYAVGASSGGRFATSLHPRFPIVAANAIVSASVASVRPPPHPPLAFTHMHERDQRTAQNVDQDVEILQSHGTPVTTFTVAPRPVSVDFLRTAFPSWDNELVVAVQTALKEAGFLEATGHLIVDPRATQWRSAVRHLARRMNDSLIRDRSPLSEELNRAWGTHEMTADYFSNVLDFFSEHIEPLPALRLKSPSGT